jgi:hypothetical protein
MYNEKYHNPAKMTGEPTVIRTLLEGLPIVYERLNTIIFVLENEELRVLPGN